MPVSAERVSARASTFRSRTRTLPGILLAMRSRRCTSIRAGIQRTENEPFESLAVELRRVRRRSCGTIAPRAVSSTAQMATCPNQRTLDPMLSPT